MFQLGSARVASLPKVTLNLALVDMAPSKAHQDTKLCPRVLKDFPVFEPTLPPKHPKCSRAHRMLGGRGHVRLQADRGAQRAAALHWLAT